MILIYNAFANYVIISVCGLLKYFLWISGINTPAGLSLMFESRCVGVMKCKAVSNLCMLSEKLMKYGYLAHIHENSNTTHFVCLMHLGACHYLNMDVKCTWMEYVGVRVRGKMHPHYKH